MEDENNTEFAMVYGDTTLLLSRIEEVITGRDPHNYLIRTNKTTGLFGGQTTVQITIILEK